MVESIIDSAHAAMQADVNNDAARLRFYEKLVGSELFLLLESEPEGDRINPRVFDIKDESFVLLFDREDRLAQFAGMIAPYASLSGRTVFQMLAPQGLGLGFNLDVAPSSILLPSEAVQWLADMETTPDEITEKVEKFYTPKGLPEVLLSALDTRLAAAKGLADLAYLVGVEYANGGTGHLLGFVNARPEAHTALTRTVAQALVFSGLEAGTIDVGFFDASNPAAAKLAKCGLGFDLPQAQAAPRVAPGSDPDKPPVLR